MEVLPHITLGHCGLRYRIDKYQAEHQILQLLSDRVQLLAVWKTSLTLLVNTFVFVVKHFQLDWIMGYNFQTIPLFHQSLGSVDKEATYKYPYHEDN